MFGPWKRGRGIMRRARMRICWKYFGAPGWAVVAQNTSTNPNAPAPRQWSQEPGWGRDFGQGAPSWGRGMAWGAGGPGFGWRWGRGVWLIQPPSSPPQPQEQSRSAKDVKKRAKEILKKASIGPSNPWNWLFPIIYEGRVVGYLWEIVPLDKLEFGGIHEVSGEKRLALIYNDRVVGYLIV